MAFALVLTVLAVLSSLGTAAHLQATETIPSLSSWTHYIDGRAAPVMDAAQDGTMTA